MTKDNNLAVKDIREKIKNETLSLFEKKRYREYLETISSFPEYSANNQILIFCQDSTASMVCGYAEWQKKYNRHVVKGGKGIKILAPRTKAVWEDKKDARGNIILDKNGKPVREKRNRLMGFCTKTVFDVSQTAGDPVPSITTLLSENVDGYSELLDVLRSVSPAEIIFTDDGCFGYDDESSMIRISSSSTQQQTIQKLLPSIASVLLCRNTGTMYEPESLEAESCAYIVARHFGIDNDYDFDYIADWYDGKSLEDLSASLKIIHDISDGLIKDISRAVKHAATA